MRPAQSSAERRRRPIIHRFFAFSALTSKSVWVEVRCWHKSYSGQFVRPLSPWLLLVLGDFFMRHKGLIVVGMGLALLVSGCIYPHVANESPAVTGRIVDAKTHQPVAGATVSWLK